MELREKENSTRSLGYGSFSTLLNRPVLTISVEEGPGKGETVRFDQAHVTFGSGDHNDFVLADTTITERHGAFFRSDEGFLFNDFTGSVGTLIALDREGEVFKPTTKEVPVVILRNGYLRMGRFLLRVSVDWVYHSEHETGAFRIKLTKKDAREFLAVQKPSVDLQHLKGKDPRLEILFELAFKLNRLRHLDEILDLIAGAAFKAFLNANLFSVSLLEGDELRPIRVRVRDLIADRSPEVVLSRSVLNRVVETEEAVLFVKGEQKVVPSKSMVMAEISACMCAPLVGQGGLLGVMQMDTRKSGQRFTRNDLGLFCVLASHAAFGLERANLGDDIYRMFERFVEASVSAIEARDPTTAGHSERVAKYSLSLAETANRIEVAPFATIRFSSGELTELRYAALLHDFGKVGVREAVLMKESRLSVQRMEKIVQHFKLIQCRFKEKLMASYLYRAVKLGRPVCAEELHEIEHKSVRFNRVLDRECAFLEEVREQWSLGPAEIKRIKGFGQRHFETLDGEVMRFLTDDEIENFTIPVGTLTEREWEDMRTHVSQSEAYLRRIPWSDDLKQVPCIAGAHHEKLDGSGYPRGLTSDEISPRVRILTIADIFDAVTAWDRPYNIPLSVEGAMKLLRRKAGQGRIDKKLVDLFITQVIPKVAHLVPVQK